MLKRVSRPALWALAVCGVVGLSWMGRPVVAQDDTLAQPTIELDVQRFVEGASSGGRGLRFNDAVWEIRPGSDRKTVLLPIRVTPGSAEYELSRPSISVRSARFIGWYIAPPTNGRNNNSNDGEPFQAGGSLDLEALLLGEDTANSDNDNERGRGELGGPLDATDAATDGSDYDPVPDDAPRLARKVTVHPDGTIGWEMDRAFSGAEVRSAGQNNLYGYKLDPEALRNQQPERPERLERGAGESGRDFADRRRTQQETYRDDSEAYRELRDTVRDLSEDFREPGDGVVYAVFDAPLSETWAFTGDVDWRIEQEDLDAIASLAGNRAQGSGNGLDARTVETVDTLTRLANRGTAFDHRAIALAAYQGRLADLVVRNGDGFKLLARLAASDDERTRVIVLSSIARVQPPTRASVQLLAEAAREASGELAETLALASMRSAFRIEAGAQGEPDFLLAQVNNALSATDGPPPARVLEEAIDAVALSGTQGQSGRGAAQADTSDAVTLLIHETAFEHIRIDHMEAVVAMIVRRSPDSALAAGWLDVQLLRSSDDGLLDQTLALLAKADSTSRVIQPLTDELRTMVFGDSAQDSATREPAIVLNGVIPLASEDHGLVIALTSGDAERRARAWEVLRHFELAGATGSQDDRARATFDRIVGIGLDVASHPDTPPSLVDFIDNQGDGPLGESARTKMLELIGTEGVTPATARRAARKIVGSGQDYSTALAALDTADRGALVARVYELLLGETPPIVGLIGAEGQNTMVRWLAEAWQRGELPDEAAWAQAAADYDDLLQLAGSSQTAIAHGAAAAMVLRAGGTAEQQQALIQAIAALGNRSPESVASAWEPIRRDIFASRLTDAAGAYRIVLSVYDAEPDPGFAPGRGGNPGGRGRDNRGGQSPGRLAEPGLQPGSLGPATPSIDATADTASAEPTATYDLGLVQMQVEGGDVTLSIDTVVIRLAHERLALQITRVSDLAGFDAPGLDELPLSQLDEPVDLLPVDADTWVGSIKLPDGRRLEVSYTRER